MFFLNTSKLFTEYVNGRRGKMGTCFESLSILNKTKNTQTSKFINYLKLNGFVKSESEVIK